jgi:hypothetical protein
MEGATAKTSTAPEQTQTAALTNVQASRARPAARSALPHRAQTGHLIRVGNEPRSGAHRARRRVGAGDCGEALARHHKRPRRRR